MERIDRIVIRRVAIDELLCFIEELCKLIVFFTIGRDHVRTGESIPVSLGNDLDVILIVIFEVCRHHAGIALQHGLHAQGTLPALCASGQFHPVDHIVIRDRSAKHFHIVHELPCVVSWPGQPVFCVIIRISEVHQELDPCRFLTSQIQYDIHAVQCQPVILTLPFLFAKERKCIAQSTVIERVAHLHVCFFAHGAVDRYDLLRHRILHRLLGNLHIDIILIVVIQPGRQGKSFIALDVDLSILIAQLKVIVVVFCIWRDFKAEPVAILCTDRAVDDAIHVFNGLFLTDLFSICRIIKCLNIGDLFKGAFTQRFSVCTALFAMHLDLREVSRRFPIGIFRVITDDPIAAIAFWCDHIARSILGLVTAHLRDLIEMLSIIASIKRIV